MRARVSRREVRELLAQAALRPIEVARPGFISELDIRLRTQTPPGRLVALPGRARRRHGAVVVTGIAAAAAAAVLLGALTGVYGRSVEDRALALAVAIDTTVQMPDGSTIAGVRGTALPDGAVVRTGPHGHCSAGDVEFGPGIEALVDSGRLRLRSAAPALAGPGDVTGSGVAGSAATSVDSVIAPVAIDAPATQNPATGAPLAPGTSASTGRPLAGVGTGPDPTSGGSGSRRGQ